MSSFQKVKTSIASTLFILSSSVFASNLDIKRPYVLYYLDGQKSTSSFLKDSSNLTLTKGNHQVVIRFEGAYRDGKETRIVTSEPIVINFNVDNSDTNYEINFEYPRNYKYATKYVENPTITLQTTSGQPIENAEIFVLPHKDGLQIGRDYLREIQDLGKGYVNPNGEPSKVVVANANAATIDIQKTFSIEKPTNNIQTKTVSTELSSQNITNKNSITNVELEQLKEIYNKASPDVQKQFKIWIVTGE